MESFSVFGSFVSCAFPLETTTIHGPCVTVQKHLQPSSGLSFPFLMLVKTGSILVTS